MERERERQHKELARRKLVRQLNTEYRMECVDTSRKQQLYARETLLNKIKAQTVRPTSCCSPCLTVSWASGWNWVELYFTVMFWLSGLGGQLLYQPGKCTVHSLLLLEVKFGCSTCQV